MYLNGTRELCGDRSKKFSYYASISMLLSGVTQ